VSGLATVAKTSIAFRSGTIIVHDTGEGPPLGYLHGLVGNRGVEGFLGVLAETTGHRVIAPALPGFSGSAPCEDARTLHDWTVIASEVIDVAGLAGSPMVASSTGAMLALEVAAIRPEAFGALVLVAPFGLWDPADPVADPYAATLQQQRDLLTADPRRTAAFYEDPDGADPEELVEQHVERYLTRASASSLVWPVPEFGLATRLHRVTCPVSIVWGGDDRLVPPSYLDRFRAALPNVVTTRVVEGAGHLAEWDRPDEVARFVAETLRP
jgi:pimeloyl-ACP methyl ester carboxylesterase